MVSLEKLKILLANRKTFLNEYTVNGNHEPQKNVARPEC